MFWTVSCGKVWLQKSKEVVYVNRLYSPRCKQWVVVRAWITMSTILPWNTCPLLHCTLLLSGPVSRVPLSSSGHIHPWTLLWYLQNHQSLRSKKAMDVMHHFHHHPNLDCSPPYLHLHRFTFIDSSSCTDCPSTRLRSRQTALVGLVGQGVSLLPCKTSSMTVSCSIKFGSDRMTSPGLLYSSHLQL